MNIFVLIILILQQEDTSVVLLKERTREFRRQKRDKAIAHNRRTYNNRVGGETWFDKPDNNGVYRRYASGQYHTNAQQGRWATYHLSGHRRFAKWCREAYPSFVDEKATARWEDELKEYLNS